MRRTRLDFIHDIFQSPDVDSLNVLLSMWKKLAEHVEESTTFNDSDEFIMWRLYSNFSVNGCEDLELRGSVFLMRSFCQVSSEYPYQISIHKNMGVVAQDFDFPKEVAHTQESVARGIIEHFEPFDLMRR